MADLKIGSVGRLGGPQTKDASQLVDSFRSGIYPQIDCGSRLEIQSCSGVGRPMNRCSGAQEDRSPLACGVEIIGTNRESGIGLENHTAACNQRDCPPCQDTVAIGRHTRGVNNTVGGHIDRTLICYERKLMSHDGSLHGDIAISDTEGKRLGKSSTVKRRGDRGNQGKVSSARVKGAHIHGERTIFSTTSPICR